MKNESLRGLKFCPGKFKHNSLRLLAAATIAATTGSLQAIADDKGSMPTEDAVIAAEPATPVYEQAAAGHRKAAGLQGFAPDGRRPGRDPLPMVAAGRRLGQNAVDQAKARRRQD